MSQPSHVTSPKKMLTPPNWIQPQDWKTQGFLRLTTPMSDGYLLTGGKDYNTTMSMTLPNDGGIYAGNCVTGDTVGCTQSWHWDGGNNFYQAQPDWKDDPNRALSFNVTSSHCGNDPLQIRVADTSNEDTWYYSDTGLLQHKNFQKIFGCETYTCNKEGSCPYKNAFICDNGDGTLREEINKSVAQNNPDCLWINQDTILNCCLLPAGSVDKSTKQCWSSYVPGKSNSYCVDYMTNYCSGNWINNEACNNYIREYNANYNDVSKVIEKTIVNYVNQDSRTPHDYVSSRDSDDPFFKKTVPFLCNTVPGSGNKVLSQLCAEFTRDDLNADTTLQAMCGCFLSNGTTPSDVGLKLSNPPAPNQYIFPFITRECDPLCSFAQTIPYGTQSSNGWVPLQCQQSICMLNDLTYNQINSSGDFNIDLYCGDCKGGTCQCVIDGLIVNDINSQGEINITQNCGSCFTVDNNNPASDPTPIDCSNLSPLGKNLWIAFQQFMKNNKITIFMVSMFMGLILGGTFFYLYKK